RRCCHLSLRGRAHPTRPAVPYTTLFRSQAAGGDRLGPVPGGKGGIDRRVDLLPADVAAGSRVLVQQAGDDGVLAARLAEIVDGQDRKSTRLNSSHVSIS